MKISLREIERRMERFVEVCWDSDMKLTHQRMEIFREAAQTGDQKTIFRSGVSLPGRILCRHRPERKGAGKLEKAGGDVPRDGDGLLAVQDGGNSGKAVGFDYV